MFSMNEWINSLLQFGRSSTLIIYIRFFFWMHEDESSQAVIHFTVFLSFNLYSQEEIATSTYLGEQVSLINRKQREKEIELLHAQRFSAKQWIEVIHWSSFLLFKLLKKGIFLYLLNMSYIFCNFSWALIMTIFIAI